MWKKNIGKLQHPYFCLGVVENTILHRGEQEKKLIISASIEAAASGVQRGVYLCTTAQNNQ